MASPQGWRRNKKMERRKENLYYYWENPEMPDNNFIKISKQSSPYQTGGSYYSIAGFFKGRSIGGGFFSGGDIGKETYSNKEDARKDAVKFMRNHKIK